MIPATAAVQNDLSAARRWGAALLAEACHWHDVGDAAASDRLPAPHGCGEECPICASAAAQAERESADYDALRDAALAKIGDSAQQQWLLSCLREDATLRAHARAHVEGLGVGTPTLLVWAFGPVIGDRSRVNLAEQPGND